MLNPNGNKIIHSGFNFFLFSYLRFQRRNPPRRSSSSSLPFSPKSSKKDNGLGDNGDDSNNNGNADVFTDTYVGPNSLKAALSAAGTVCRAIDVVMNGENVNAFACIRPPGHHCGRNGCTKGSLSTGFCLLNNAAIGLMYARVFWGLTRVAIVDIDVHFGNGTAEIVKNDPDTFFASIHMIYGPKNDGNYYDHAPNVNCGCGFYPPQQGLTEVTNNYVSVGVYPDDIFAKECVPKSFPPTSSARKSTRGGTGGGATTRSRSSNNNSSHHSSRRSNYSLTEESNNDDSDELKSISDDDESIKSLHEDAMEVEEEEKEVLIPNPLPIYSGPSGYIAGIRDVIIPKLIAFRPELLIISAGFDGCSSDPLGGEMNLSTQDYHECTTMVSPLYLIFIHVPSHLFDS
jgi:acetoin utilization deacetylase AcuC-like enzyme